MESQIPWDPGRAAQETKRPCPVQGDPANMCMFGSLTFNPKQMEKREGAWLSLCLFMSICLNFMRPGHVYVGAAKALPLEV